MTNNGEQENNQQQEAPEFKGEYFWAFCTLMLYKLGGFEAIKLEHLEKYDYENDCPQVSWDAKNQAFIMRFNDNSKPPSKISLPGKIRKRMARKTKEQVIAELTDMHVDFDSRESYNNLVELLRIETRNRQPAPQPDQPPQEESDDPLTPEERQELNRLEQMASKGRKIDQPTPEEMLKLGKLRKRANL
jgi:hypothetical protein